MIGCLDTSAPSGDHKRFRERGEDTMADNPPAEPDSRPAQPPQSDHKPANVPFNSSSLYTIILDKALVAAKSPAITVDGSGNLTITVGPLTGGHHAMDQRDPAFGSGGTPKVTTLTLTLS